MQTMFMHKKTINLNNNIMIKKLLLGIVAVALSSSVAMAEMRPIHLTNNGLVRKDLSQLQSQGIKLGRQATVKAPAAEDTEIFFEDFETFNSETMVPHGWDVVDNTVDGGVFCANILESSSGYISAFSGEFGLASMFSDESHRDGWAIATGVQLEANHTYHFGIYAFCQGYNSVVDEWQVTIGNAQTVEAQTNIVIDCTGVNAKTDNKWTLYTGTFTPTVSGTYYPAIHHCTTAKGGNLCLWDYMQIDSDHVKILPQGSMFSIGGLWSMDGHTQDEEGNIDVYRLYIQNGDSIKYGCYASNCESVSWDFGKYATTPNNDAAQPVVTFDFAKAKSDEVYNDVYLTMKNQDGEAYAIREFFINRLNNETAHTDFVGNFCPEDGFYLFSGGGSYDALSGLNSNYYRFAERYSLPENVTASVSGAYMIPLRYTISIVNKNKEFAVKVLLADENNMPGEEVYSEKFKIGDVFGTASFQSAVLVGLAFSETVDVKGTFFLEFEFPEGIKIGSNNHLFFATSNVRAFPEGNTAFYYNAVGTADMPSGWMDAIQYYKAGGVSTAIFPLVTFNDNAAVVAPKVSDCTVYANGSEITVVNAPQGSEIVVADIAGRVVLTERANNLKTNINSGLNAGIYIVTVNGQSTKVAIR